jgi:hypothetical protein
MLSSLFCIPQSPSPFIAARKTPEHLKVSTFPRRMLELFSILGMPSSALVIRILFTLVE